MGTYLGCVWMAELPLSEVEQSVWCRLPDESSALSGRKLVQSQCIGSSYNMLMSDITSRILPYTSVCILLGPLLGRQRFLIAYQLIPPHSSAIL